MNPRKKSLLAAVMAVSLSLAACKFLLPGLRATPTPLAQAQPASTRLSPTQAPTRTPAAATQVPDRPAAGPSAGPFEITGVFTYSNSLITDYYVEQAVALVDMYGFVTRNQDWEIPVASQTLGYLNIDQSRKEGDFTLQLPARPTGEFVDVDNNGRKDHGVQVFAVSYWPNLAAGPYSEGDDPSRGWPAYLASVRTDTENHDEVIGGKLVVWAPDAQQEFPTGFGADHKLFTADDPVGPLPAGYSIVDLDQQPFAVSQEPQPALTLYEPKDAAIKDYSHMSYTQAFDALFAQVEKEYAFNGIAGKQPDWDALKAELRPRVEQAEKDKDPREFYLALRDYTWAFKDGHVGLNGGQVANEAFTQATSGGYGFAIRQLDDGRVVVVYVLDGGPAARAGIKVGAAVTEFNGQPIQDAIAAVKPWAAPFSSDFNLHYQQARYLLRTTPNTEASVTYINPGESSKTARLVSISERESFGRTSIYYGADPNPMLPVEFRILASGVGYVKINSNYDDLNLIIRLFQRALATFQAAHVPGIIIDMRLNSGGANLGLAGFLTSQKITLGQLEYYSDETRQFEPEGSPEFVMPMQEQYHFDKMALLVGLGCASACEIEAYGFSQVPGMEVVGQYPTSGTEAEVARGQFLLPEGFSMQVPTGRFTLPDGSLFLEGKGVVPTIHVPIDETTVLSQDDVVLKAAENAILVPEGAGITPAAPPKLLTVDDVQSLLTSGQVTLLEQKAREQYTTDELNTVNRTFTYTVSLNESETLAWAWGWCAKDQATLDGNLGRMTVQFSLAGTEVGLDKFLKLDSDNSQGQTCRTYVTALEAWQAGENHLTTTVTFKAAVNDGSAEYAAGKQVFEYIVYVK
jgi:C-terminal processing protease CtpA/Prc